MANGLAPRFFPGERTGRVLLDGEEVGDLATWRIAERAGTLFQNPRTQFFNVDATGEAAFALESAGWPGEEIRARVGETFRELGLEDLAGRSVFRLSGGQRQKVAYASIWALRPSNLLLDEPTSNLDMPSIADIAAFVVHAKAAGRSILVAEHRLAWLTGIADAYVYLEEGRVSRVMEAREFAALSPQELVSMGLRTRDLDDVAPANDAVAPPGRRGVALSARGLSVDYGRGPVVREADVDLRSGEVVALAGRNGAGKTTLCRALCGFERKAKGAVSLDGRRAARKRRVRASSMVFQDVDCLAADKRLLVFDEPTSGIDLDGMRRVARLLSRLAGQGRAILVVTHDLELIACACDRVLHMDGGRVVGQASVRDDFDAVRAMTGASASVQTEREEKHP